MHLSRHPTSYPTRWQEIAAKLEVELRTHYRCGDYLPAEQQLAPGGLQLAVAFAGVVRRRKDEDLLFLRHG